MSSATTALIVAPTDSEWATVKAPFNQSFVDELKEVIPRGERRFEKSTETWYVGLDWLYELQQVAENHYDDVEVKEGDNV